MCTRFILLLHFLIAMYLAKEAVSLLVLRNIKCQTLDEEFSNFEYCILKSVNRTYKYISLKVNLLKVPISSVQVNVELFQRLNGYKPFLYNITIDACKFFKNQKSNPVASYFYDSFKKFSNINHSCPYNHDLVLEKLSADFLNHRFTKILPFPKGEYMIQMNWFAYHINRAQFQLHFVLS
ncbi:uncharacterized protein LOC108093703 [Drosophila ficusphila]|uniref:uncharacterized protein LOC108093703 n=1 Tax=Drosophila ficusphila TaxID=30025 RepID=UPI0007E6A2A0|nr:uncharacterized protein LOC108093703 [Drosophila ficusphila]XP_017049383.1 uncharacterized protein LOC108093703 [Drosophila ficusphila]XP_017049384.1 uncharacterized protein LOC108093703 [Drosophila ficusphila]